MKISFVKIYLYSFLFCLLALCCLSSPARAAITSCQQYDSSTTVKSGFGVPYNTLSAAKETIINGDFDDASVQVTVNLGNGSSQMYIYNQGYIWRGGAWQPVSLAAGSKGSSGSWRIGRASAVITTTAAELSSGFYVIAHICSWTGTAWKCGCRDSACATPYWQLQRFQHAASPVCGNGHCESGSGETCSTCSTDCGPCSGSDTTAPVVSSFSVAPTSLSAGSQITASYSVTDNAALASVELFRAPSGVNCSDTTKIGCVWTQVNSANISGVSYSDTLTDTPPSANTYYYGIHVLDTAAPTPNTGYEPSPIKVTVTGASFSVNITSPVNNSTYTQSQIIILSSSVSGGTTPITYRWTSNVYGVISNQQNLALQTVTNTAMTTEIAGLYNIYAPSLLTISGVKRMWSGGWLTSSQYGDPDRIFYSTYNSGSWSWPIAVKWTNGGYSDGQVPGYLVNDPTVIIEPSNSWLFMYYTALPQSALATSDWTKHAVGFASSVDGGITWTDHGLIITPTTGAWAPSALISGSEIWIYYMDGTPAINLHRQRVNLNGWQLIGGEDKVNAPAVVSNVDVSMMDNKYIMVANAPDLKSIVRYISVDGLNFVNPSHSNPIISGGSSNVLTPHVEMISATQFKIYFGYDTTGTNLQSSSIQAWTFDASNPLSSGIHTISLQATDSLGANANDAVNINIGGSGSDTTAPVVSSFSVAPTSLSAGSQITASYSVTDNAALASVELFRAPSGVNCSDTTKIGCVWTQVNSANISGVSYSGTLTDTPPSANTYYYGIHVLDTAAPTPNIGYEPSPIKVTVTTSCTAGCVGDGVADDTTCLQNLFNSSCATVTLPAGKIYKVTSALSVPGNKTIIGSASTIITQDDTNQLIYISGSNVTLRNIHLTYQPPAFNINRGLIVNLGPSVKNIIVDNCVLSGAYAIVGVHINNPDIENVTIADNEFNNMYYGVLYNTTNFNATQRQDYNMHLSGLTVSGNKMYGLQGDGVAINSPVYAYSPYCSGGSGVSANNITISNNEIYAPNSKMIAYGFCVSVAGAVDVVISENSLINCKWQGVHIEDSADNVTVIRNYIYNIIGSESDDLESWTSGRAGVWVAGSKNIWILDNHIEKTIDEGILLIPSTTLYLPCSTSYPRYNNTCAISANRVIDAGTYGISVGGPDGIDVNFYIGPIAAQSLAGNNVIGSGIAPYILNGSPTGVTVTGNSW